MSETPDPLDWLEAARRQPGGSRAQFQQQLADIDRLLIEAADTVAERIRPVTTAFLQADVHGAEEAIAAGADLDERCVQLEEGCYVLLARQSPVAGDLRRIVAVLRSVADVERSGNLLRHVAASLTWIHPPSLDDELRETIQQLGDVSSEIFAGAVEAWRRHDGLAAAELEERDDQVDLLQKYLLTELYTGESSVEEAVSLALVARYYERIADHGVEMSRQVAYFLTGERIRDSDMD